MPPGKPLNQNKRKRYNKREIHIFFRRLQEKRIELNMTQEYLAKKFGTSISAISRMEAGGFPNDPARIALIADILHVSLDWLFGRTEHEP